MKILATYSDGIRTYNIVDNLQIGDPVLYEHVYSTTEKTHCDGIGCDECAYNGINCSSTRELLRDNRFDTLFPTFRKDYPELLL